MNKQGIISAVENYGSYGKLYLPKGKRVYNEWNAWVTGVYYNERCGLFVSVYVQGDSTDDDDSVRFDEFLKGGRYSGTTNCHGFRFSFDESEKKQAIKAICDHVADLNGGLGNKQKTLERLTHYSLINPILNKWYDTYNLKWHYHSEKGSRTYAAYKAYCVASEALQEFIKDNVEMLADKTNDQLSSIYNQCFHKVFLDNFNW